MFDWYYRLINPEFRIGDFLMPWGMIMGTLGFLSAWAITTVLERVGWTRFIWHLPLFFVALAVLMGSLFGLILTP